MPALLAEHAASPLQDYGLGEWLLLNHQRLRPPARVMMRWDRTFAPVLATLENGADGASRG